MGGAEGHPQLRHRWLTAPRTCLTAWSRDHKKIDQIQGKEIPGHKKAIDNFIRATYTRRRSPVKDVDIANRSETPKGP